MASPEPERSHHSPETAAEPPDVQTPEDVLRDALTAIRRLALAQVAAAWSVVTVAELSATVPAFAALASVAVLSGQRAAVRFADLWLSRVLSRPPVGVDPTPFLGASGTPVPLPAVLAGTSSANVRHALGLGHDPETALAHGLHRVERLASTEVYRAGTDAVAALAEADGLPGWRRALSPKACEVCRGLAGDTVHPWADRVAAHPHCSCVPLPVLR